MSIARANAAVNQCYFFSLNLAPRLGFGRSAVYGPGGEVIHVAGAGREVIPVELDLEYVRRVCRRGWNGLGQMLKSFRDAQADLASPIADRANSEYLKDLGALDLLMVTDVTGREFIYGKLLGICWNTKEFILPPLILAIIYAVRGQLASAPPGNAALLMHKRLLLST